ncbi:hypothetical protein [Plantactinospora soyae]|uniref:Uncharacterized protein n=1 Tax=Plantactinospora soyae TaxID=1544732 RepID=A0A927QZ70_9ACTN|nr:hypothetical protein [Plantactinospora soyae]MBE1488702.1 hypothetical protein [Plantactinospora soyae]
MAEGGPEDWVEQRRRAVAAHAAADERRRDVETGQARQLVVSFLQEARERGLRQTPLTAIAYNGRSRYRTPLVGWYLDVALIHAVDGDGAFYVLTVPASLRARLTGATPHPSPPKLVIGEGGPDGQSMPLHTMLRRRLDAGDTWPPE